MLNLARMLRLISLAILFGGSTAIVFAAITLVKTAKASGMAVEDAAAINAPVFIEFSKVALGFAVCLVVSEAYQIRGNLKNLEKHRRWPMARFVASILCAIATFVFSLGIVPPMQEALPKIKTDKAAHAQFQKMHHLSRGVFMAIIVFAMSSLIIPPISGNRAPE